MKIEYSQHVFGPPSSHSGGGGVDRDDNVCEDDKLG